LDDVVEPVPEPTIHVRGLGVRLGARTVIDGVELEIERGARTVIVGPNGSGKTTLLRTIGGAVSPAAGTVLLEGQLVHRLPRRERACRIARLAQGAVVPEGLTVRQLVEQGRYPHVGALGMLRMRDGAVVDEALRRVGLFDMRMRYVDELSGGERQRAWLALVIAQEATTLLLDEPTTHLDLRHQLSALALIVELQRERGLTVVAVLHDLNHALVFADNLIVLARGRVVAAGRPAHILDEELIAEVFGIRAALVPHPESEEVPVVVPLAPETPAIDAGVGP
jgi:iron complex transport system ATP-binding protein